MVKCSFLHMNGYCEVHVPHQANCQQLSSISIASGVWDGAVCWRNEDIGVWRSLNLSRFWRKPNWQQIWKHHTELRHPAIVGKYLQMRLLLKSKTMKPAAVNVSLKVFYICNVICFLRYLSCDSINSIFFFFFFLSLGHGSSLRIYDENRLALYSKHRWIVRFFKEYSISSRANEDEHIFYQSYSFSECQISSFWC